MITGFSTRASHCLHFFWGALLFLTMATGVDSKAQAITEGFNNVQALTSAGWFLQNNSQPAGDGWYSGDPAIFPAQSGPANSYILAYSGNTVGTGTISNWLLSPAVTFRNGDVISFYTRKISPDAYPDRLQVRISTSGSGTNVGNTATSVGDFTTLLLDINPTLTQGIYPTAWTQYTLTVTGLAAPATGRVAFRYFVTDGGPTGNNSELIGIDQFMYTPNCPVITVSPATLPSALAGSAYNQPITQSGGTGTIIYSVTSGVLPAGLSLSGAGILSGTATTAGVYNFTVTATDANACTGSGTYTLSVCPTISLGPAALSNTNIGTTYSQTITQTGTTGTITYTVAAGALPPGLTLSATGVLSGAPTQTGSFSFTIQATDQNNCSGTRSYVVTVGCVTNLAVFAPICSNNGPYTLTGGTPAGGVYTGTGVSNGVFDPAVGTQVITYTYTSSTGCTSSSSRTLTVNNAPAVSLNPFAAPICLENGAITLTGGFPAGGVYSGNGVSNGVFVPSAPGIAPITYSITENNCTASQTQNLTVEACMGIADNLKAEALICYPNPSSGKFTIKLIRPAADEVVLRVYSLHGTEIERTNNILPAGMEETTLDLSKYAKGVYMIKAELPNGAYAYTRVVLK